MLLNRIYIVMHVCVTTIIISLQYIIHYPNLVCHSLTNLIRCTYFLKTKILKSQLRFHKRLRHARWRHKLETFCALLTLSEGMQLWPGCTSMFYCWSRIRRQIGSRRCFEAPWFKTYMILEMNTNRFSREDWLLCQVTITYIYKDRFWKVYLYFSNPLLF